MRGTFIFLGLFGVVIIGGYTFLQHQMVRDRGRLIAVAFGVPAGDTIQMHVAVSDMMTLRDPPQTTPKGVILWKDWVSEHWVLRDDSGERLDLRRLGMSALMMDSNAAGSPKFCMTATLKQGADYTFDFIPITAKSERYRYAFTAPSEPQDVWRMNFKPVEDDTR